MKERFIAPISYTYEYPENQHGHMIDPYPKYHPVLDENYQYREYSFAYKFKRFWLCVFMNLIALPVCAIRYAIKVEGKRNLREVKKEIKNGFVTVCNHVFYWDYLSILWALYPRKGYFPIWNINMRDPKAPAFKLIGGIPVPVNSVHAGKKFNDAMNSVLEEKKWLHVYPEGSMWFWYPAVREFMPGAFTYAYSNNVPVIPLALSYRAPKGIYRLFKKEPCVTVHIGKPVYADKSLSRRQAITKLTDDVRTAVMKLLNIDSEEENSELMNLYKK